MPPKDAAEWRLALHTLAVRHGVSQVSVAVGPYYSGEAATLALPPDADWRALHALLSDIADCANQSIDVKLDTHHGELYVAAVPLTGEAAEQFAAELERLTEGHR